MREIKFRAWDPNAKHMSYGRIEHFDDSIMFRFDHFDCEPEEVVYLQYTGIKDKNGKEIYEGDLLEYYRNNKSSVVVFINGSFCIKTNDCYDFFHELQGFVNVIGNIYEHPHLLKEANTHVQDT